jgi:hypothetical protein
MVQFPDENVEDFLFFSNVPEYRMIQFLGIIVIVVLSLIIYIYINPKGNIKNQINKASPAFIAVANTKQS